MRAMLFPAAAGESTSVDVHRAGKGPDPPSALTATILAVAVNASPYKAAPHKAARCSSADDLQSGYAFPLTQKWKDKQSNTTLFEYHDIKHNLGGGCLEVLVEYPTPKTSAITLRSRPGPHARRSDRYAFSIGSMTTRASYVVNSGETCHAVFDDAMTGGTVGIVVR